ncbi:MAG: ion transporter [Bacteroidetes bacterium]|nr:ion transporter [Bacteroidota bacterium]
MNTSKLKERVYVVIFESDTPYGKLFDILLLIAIVLSVLSVMLESVAVIGESIPLVFFYVEVGFTIIFSIEYALRIYSAPVRKKYILSFYGIIDLVSILPSFLIFFISGTKYVLIIRSLRLLRIFRVLKLTHFLGEAEVLGRAIRQSVAKITVFIGVVVILTFIIGAVMYLIEGPEHGFTNIPISIYWAIVTLTTVGYGDIAPETIPGRMIASIVMILGYGIIAVPTGIVSVEISKAERIRFNRDPVREAPFCPNIPIKGKISPKPYIWKSVSKAGKSRKT